MKLKSILCAAALTCASAVANAAPVQWTAASGGNDHWYEVVYQGGGSITWSQANKAASGMTYQGLQGHLATITSAGEQKFVNFVNTQFTTNSRHHHGKYVDAWLGASDANQEGKWEWVTGEAFSYSNWARFQPNNWGNQDYLAGWYSRDKWNDCSDSCGIYKFVVEYGTIAPVPLPASLPLAAAGLGVMGWFGRRRRKAAQ